MVDPAPIATNIVLPLTHLNDSTLIVTTTPTKVPVPKQERNDGVVTPVSDWQKYKLIKMNNQTDLNHPLQRETACTTDKSPYDKLVVALKSTPTLWLAGSTVFKTRRMIADLQRWRKACGWL